MEQISAWRAVPRETVLTVWVYVDLLPVSNSNKSTKCWSAFFVWVNHFSALTGDASVRAEDIEVFLNYTQICIVELFWSMFFFHILLCACSPWIWAGTRTPVVVCSCLLPAWWRSSGDSSVHSAGGFSQHCLCVTLSWQSGKKVSLSVCLRTPQTFDHNSPASYFHWSEYETETCADKFNDSWMRVRSLHSFRSSSLPGCVPRRDGSRWCSQRAGLGLSF